MVGWWLSTDLERTGVTTQAWHLLAIFLATIVGIITQPLPLGAVAMLGLGTTMLTKVLTFGAAFSAFSSEIPYAPFQPLPTEYLHPRWGHNLGAWNRSTPLSEGQAYIDSFACTYGDTKQSTQRYLIRLLSNSTCLKSLQMADCNCVLAVWRLHQVWTG